MFSQREMTVIPVFWIRILLMLPRTFICDQILPRLLPAQRTGYRSENWILKAHRESNPERSTSAATKQNKQQSHNQSDRVNFSRPLRDQ